MSGGIHLSKRLQAVADLVTPGSITDVGTDHGYLPVYLLEQGIASKVTASDINKGPLSAARTTAASHGLEHQINFVLCDGLSECMPTDNVVIAGMGGETIIHILQTAPWTKNGSQLILQPQSKQDLLTKWLNDNGYCIYNARLVKDDGKIYTIFSVKGGTPSPISSPVELYINRLLINNRDPLLPEYTSTLIKRMEKTYHGLERASVERQTEKDLIRQILIGLYEIQQEVNRW